MTKTPTIQLSPLEEELLFALGNYGYLNGLQAKQVVTRSRSATVVQRALRELARDTDLVGVAKHDRLSGQRFSYFLLPAGAALLADRAGQSSESFCYRANHTTLFSLDNPHRTMLIEFHILLARTLEHTPIFTRDGKRFLAIARMDRYFEKVPVKSQTSNITYFNAKTRVQLTDGVALVPDANIVLADRDDPDKQMLFTVEVSRGTHNADRVVKQLKHHLLAQQSGVLVEKYGLSAACRVLLIFEHESLMRAVEKRFQCLKDSKALDHLFLFAFMGDLKMDGVLSSWHTARDPETSRNFITGRL